MRIVAAGLAALAASIPVALLGRAVLEASESAAYAPRGDRSPADRVAMRLLGGEDAERFGEIVRIYKRATGASALTGQPVDAVRISRLIPEVRSRELRARAHVLVGRLLAYSAGTGAGVELERRAGEERLLEQAVAEFRAAALLDDANEEAKFDLELLLKPRRIERERARAAERDETSPSDRRRRGRQQPTARETEINRAGVYRTGSGY